MKSTLAIAALIAAVPSVLAKCCQSNGQWCADRTEPTPCCAYGRCGWFFCCQCKTECRNSNGFGRAAYQIADTDVAADVSATTEAFLQADTGSKGYLTLDDYLKYMEVKGDHQKWSDWFKRYDLDGDGKITVEEALTHNDDAV